MTGFTLHLTALYAGILTLLQIALSINVVRNRARSKVLYSDGGDETLARAMRTHGNFIEYVPMAIILMGIVELGGGPAWALHTYGLVLIVARLVHCYAIGWQNFPTRVASVLTTWVLLAGAAIWSITLASP